jgi:adenylate cyclase
MRLKPELFDACYFYARSCFAQGQMEKAAGLFQKASRLHPADYQSRAQFVGCLRSLGRTEEAREAIRCSEPNSTL